jgi:hypothetical protein
MPCYTDPDPQWVLRNRELVKLCKEVGVQAFDVFAPASADKMTQLLCTWCKHNPQRIAKASLELQIWWRDHQAADIRHAKAEARNRRQIKLRNQALSKLTPAEREALGLKKE